MAKTITGAMTSALGLEVGTFASLWVMTRNDGTIFRFTDLDKDLTYEGELYLASVGYNRTAVSNRVGLNVDNVDVSGFIDSSALADLELRAGLFDFATVSISLVDYENLAAGAIQMRTGTLGEVRYSDEGVFEVELRGLTQPYSQSFLSLYQPDCRVDLSSPQCGITLFGEPILRGVTLEVGDVVRATNLFAGIAVPTLLLPLDDADGLDISPNAFVPSVNQGTVDTTKFKFGGAARNFTTTQRMDFADDPTFEVGSNDFTVDCWVNFDSISASFWAIWSRYNNSLSDRVMRLLVNNTNMNLFLSFDGGSAAPNASYNPNPPGGFAIDTWYHLAVTRDANKVVRMYVDGVQVNGSRTDTIGVGSASTFTRTVGSWVDEGFLAGQTIVTTGFTDAANNGIFTVTGTPTATTLTISETTLVIESGTGNEIVEQRFAPDIVVDTDEPFSLAFFNSTADLHLDGTIDDFRFINGVSVWETPSFSVPTSAHSAGVTQADVDALTCEDFDDRTYLVTVAGTTSPTIQPTYDTTLGNSTVDGTATLVAQEAYVRCGIVTNVVNNRTFSISFPNGADTREIENDWFKFGGLKFETGLNSTTLTVEVKASTIPILASSSSMGATGPSTFLRAAGSFLADGYVAGMEITTSGFTNGANNGTFTIATVGTTTLTVEEATLVTEGTGSNEVMTSTEFLSLFLPKPFTVAVGDELSVYAGCDKQFTTCKSAKFNNAINFRAEPFLPGTDKLVKVYSHE